MKEELNTKVEALLAKRLGLCKLQQPAAGQVWLPVCLSAWLPGCPAAWLPVCLAAWLPSCLAARLHGCPAARLPGCLAAWLPGCSAGSPSRRIIADVIQVRRYWVGTPSEVHVVREEDAIGMLKVPSNLEGWKIAPEPA